MLSDKVYIITGGSRGFGIASVGRLKSALQSWQRQGPGMDTGMEPGHVGDAVAFCLGTPSGVSVDLLEIRPNKRVDKLVL